MKFICIVSCLLAITSNCLFADLVQTSEPLLWREPLPSVVRLSLLLSTSSLLSSSSIIAVFICRPRRQNCEGNIPTLTAWERVHGIPKKWFSTFLHFQRKKRPPFSWSLFPSAYLAVHSIRLYMSQSPSQFIHCCHYHRCYHPPLCPKPSIQLFSWTPNRPLPSYVVGQLAEALRCPPPETRSTGCCESIDKSLYFSSWTK